MAVTGGIFTTIYSAELASQLAWRDLSADGARPGRRHAGGTIIMSMPRARTTIESGTKSASFGNCAPTATSRDREQAGARYGQPTIIDQSALRIVDEMYQPLSAARTNAEAALRWLARDPPTLDEAKQALECIIGNSDRAVDVVGSVRDLVRQFARVAVSLDINGVVKDPLR
jgi:hypothetical protein